MGKNRQSPCKAVLQSSSTTSNSHKKAVKNNLMAIHLKYLDKFVTNIVLHQLRVISKKINPVKADLF